MRAKEYVDGFNDAYNALLRSVDKNICALALERDPSSRCFDSKVQEIARRIFEESTLVVKARERGFFQKLFSRITGKKQYCAVDIRGKDGRTRTTCLTKKEIGDLQDMITKVKTQVDAIEKKRNVETMQSDMEEVVESLRHYIQRNAIEGTVQQILLCTQEFHDCYARIEKEEDLGKHRENLASLKKSIREVEEAIEVFSTTVSVGQQYRLELTEHELAEEVADHLKKIMDDLHKQIEDHSDDADPHILAAKLKKGIDDIDEYLSLFYFPEK